MFLLQFKVSANLAAVQVREGVSLFALIDDLFLVQDKFFPLPVFLNTKLRNKL